MSKAVLLSGTQVSKAMQERLKQEVSDLKSQGIVPGLAVVLVGEDAASMVYVGRKTAMSEKLGIHSQQVSLPADTSQAQVLSMIDTLNKSDEVHGILVQLPLPAHIDEHAVIAAILPSKDVDAFTHANVGAIVVGDYTFSPCTPSGVMTLLAHYGLCAEGKHCVVVGRSNIVGKPMALLLLAQNGTVTICHSQTKDLADHCRRADILVAAVGRAEFITADMVKPGAIVVDVGMNRGSNGNLVGDVDFEGVSEVAGYITPVPGGVGPMTIITLMENTIKAARLAQKVELK